MGGCVEQFGGDVLGLGFSALQGTSRYLGPLTLFLQPKHAHFLTAWEVDTIAACGLVQVREGST